MHLSIYADYGIPMKFSKTFLALLGALFLTISPSSFAEERDIGALTCSDVKQSSEDEIGYIASWTLGYADGKANKTVLAMDVIDELTKYCNKSANSDSNLLKATMAAAKRAKITSSDEDMKDVTCSDFISDPSNIPYIVFWVDGYLSGLSDNTTLDDEWIGELSGQLASYCKDNRNRSVIDAVDYVIEQAQ